MSEHTIEALAKGLNAADAGRRVGWARAYAAEASKDELSRQVNMHRAERDIMRSAASFLYGFIKGYAQERGDVGVVDEALSRWSQQAGAVLDEEKVKAGREAGRSIPDAVARRDARKAEKKAERDAKKAGQNLYQRGWKAARGRESELLVKRYGFSNEAQMHSWLEEFARNPRG